jgi:hypothetical protein
MSGNLSQYVTGPAAGSRSIPKLDVNLSPVGALLANGTSRVVELGEKRVLSLTQVVTTLAGDTHDTTIETSRDGVNWYTASGTAFTQVAASQTNNTQRRVFVCDRFVRANYVVTGAPTANVVSLTGEAV